MRLAHVQANQAVVVTDRVHPWERAPSVKVRVVRVAANGKFHYVVSAKPVDQIGGCAFGDQLAGINDGQPIAKAPGLVHVMGGKPYCGSSSFQGANDTPDLNAAVS